MHWHVVSAKYLDGYRLAVTFADGNSGVVDLTKQIRSGGVFARLADPKVFQQFSINSDFGVICWGDDVDIAPETLYEQAVGKSPAAMVAESPRQYRAKRKK
ncbi:MAG: DUF2442 domain-containing protein [Verrucomicrobia bacterium]|nr:DUF2442 domain-containing protein [Verrucomicrobiota bacterium]